MTPLGGTGAWGMLCRKQLRQLRTKKSLRKQQQPAAAAGCLQAEEFHQKHVSDQWITGGSFAAATKAAKHIEFCEQHLPRDEPSLLCNGSESIPLSKPVMLMIHGATGRNCH